MNNPDIYEMKLFEQRDVKLDGSITVTRVPGGWIMTTKSYAYKGFSSVFVPFDNEFQDRDYKNPMIQK